MILFHYLSNMRYDMLSIKHEICMICYIFLFYFILCQVHRICRYIWLMGQDKMKLTYHISLDNIYFTISFSMRYDVFLYISNGIEYVMSYLHLVFKMNKKN